jgi:hypothetical protein
LRADGPRPGPVTDTRRRITVDVVSGVIGKDCRSWVSVSVCGTTVPSSKIHSTARILRFPAYQSSLPALFA